MDNQGSNTGRLKVTAFIVAVLAAGFGSIYLAALILGLTTI